MRAKSTRAVLLSGGVLLAAVIGFAEPAPLFIAPKKITVYANNSSFLKCEYTLPSSSCPAKATNWSLLLAPSQTNYVPAGNYCKSLLGAAGCTILTNEANLLSYASYPVSDGFGGVVTIPCTQAKAQVTECAQPAPAPPSSAEESACTEKQYLCVSDADGDGLSGTIHSSGAYCKEPAPYAGPACVWITSNMKQDACDKNPALKKQTPFCLDGDGDGHGSATQCAMACGPPGPQWIDAHTFAGDDYCDDVKGVIHEESYCVDKDGDGVPVNQCKLSCAKPAGAVKGPPSPADECDVDPKGSKKQVYYKDADGDGYPAQNNTREFCSAGKAGANGYSPMANGWDDCDDDPQGHKKKIYYKDSDKDGFGVDLQTTTACSVPKGYAGKSGDCDDKDQFASPGQVVQLYKDADKDGFGNPNFLSTQPSCLLKKGPIPGFVGSGNDCNDSIIGLPKMRVFHDGDGDGYGFGKVPNPLLGFTCNYLWNKKLVFIGGDCDDGNPAVNPGKTKTMYVDQDHDHFGDGTIAPVSVESCAVTATGLADNPYDCFDQDASVTSEATYYPDADQDGFGDYAKPTTVNCKTPDWKTTVAHLVTKPNDLSDRIKSDSLTHDITVIPGKMFFWPHLEHDRAICSAFNAKDVGCMSEDFWSMYCPSWGNAVLPTVALDEEPAILVNPQAAMPLIKRCLIGPNWAVQIIVDGAAFVLTNLHRYPLLLPMQGTDFSLDFPYVVKQVLMKKTVFASVFGPYVMDSLAKLPANVPMPVRASGAENIATAASVQRMLFYQGGLTAAATMDLSNHYAKSSLSVFASNPISLLIKPFITLSPQTIASLPVKADSDKDWFPDDLEKSLGLNPLTPDTDGDGFSDLEAFFSVVLAKDTTVHPMNAGMHVIVPAALPELGLYQQTVWNKARECAHESIPETLARLEDLFGQDPSLDLNMAPELAHYLIDSAVLAGAFDTTAFSTKVGWNNGTYTLSEPVPWLLGQWAGGISEGCGANGEDICILPGQLKESAGKPIEMHTNQICDTLLHEMLHTIIAYNEDYLTAQYGTLDQGYKELEKGLSIGNDYEHVVIDVVLGTSLQYGGAAGYW